MDTFVAVDGVLDDPQEKAAAIQIDKDFAAGCARLSARVLPYVDTVSAARDMDLMRIALGDAKLTYLGFSYGTYLGEHYAHLFPTHIRAMALDAVLDPSLSADDLSISQAASFDQNLKAFLAANPTEQDYLAIEKDRGMAAFLRLRTVMQWSADKPTDDEARKTGPPALGAPASGLRVLVLGDSTACSIYPGMKAVGDQVGASVAQAAVFGCGMASGEITTTRGEQITPHTERCPEMVEAAQAGTKNPFIPQMPPRR